MSDRRPARYSVLDLATVRKGSTVADAFRRTLDLARHVEQWGYTRYWLAEHHNMPGIASAATAVLIGHVAGGTSSIRVGSGGIMLPNHAALMVAEQFGTLETLYPGRIDLGIGRAPGSDTVTARAIRRGLGAGEDDFPRQLQELLSYLAAPVPGQLVRAIPGEGANVPVFLLGSSTFSAQLAAGVGLPFAFASHFAPELMYEAIEIYRRRFQPSRWLDQPYLILGIPLVAAGSDHEAEGLVTSLYQRFLQLVRGGDVFCPPPVEAMDGLWSAPERNLVERKLGAAIIGGPDTVRRKLTTLLDETLADELIFTSDLYDHNHRLRSFEIAAQIMRESSPEASFRPLPASRS